MREALIEAEKAKNKGEVPVGAIIVKEGEIVGRGHNLTMTRKDPTAHAEMIAIQDALHTLGGWRLLGCEMYVTLEPCAMCSGALVLSRIQKLVIGTPDEKSGGILSVFQIATEKRLNHQIKIEVGVLKEECSSIMKEFFKEVREKKSEDK